MKFKKSILAAGSIAAIAAPIATVISCGTDSGSSKYDVTVVTDAGKVTDKSFNQSAWEAAEQFGKDKGVKARYIEPTGPEKIVESYKAAVDGGSSLLVLPGFTHNNYVDKLPTSAKAIMVDGAIQKATADQTIALSYKVEQAAYMAGYASADYLVNVKKEATPKVGVWAGANAKGVSNFVLGYLLGVDAWDKANTDKAQVKFAVPTLTLNTGFAAGGGATVAKSLVTAGAEIIMGVAGPQTADGLKAIQGKDTKIIGVDVDQSKAYESDKDKFFTSIEKGIKTSVLSTLDKIYDGKDVAAADGVTESTVDAPQWGTMISGGLASGWTGISPTQVSDAGGSIKAAQENAVKTAAEAIKLSDDYDVQVKANASGEYKDLFSDLGITTITA